MICRFVPGVSWLCKTDTPLRSRRVYPAFASRSGPGAQGAHVLFFSCHLDRVPHREDSMCDGRCSVQRHEHVGLRKGEPDTRAHTLSLIHISEPTRRTPISY